MYTLYGIKNCDTMKKAMKWLADNSISFELIDYKKTAPEPDWVNDMIKTHGLSLVLNKRGTTYRKLDEQSKAILEAADTTKIISLLCEHSAMIKRPILEGPDSQKHKRSLIGFNPEQYADFFEKA